MSARVKLTNFEAIAHHFIEMNDASNIQLFAASMTKKAPRTTAFNTSAMGKDQITMSYESSFLSRPMLPITAGTSPPHLAFQSLITQSHLQPTQPIQEVSPSTLQGQRATVTPHQAQSKSNVSVPIAAVAATTVYGDISPRTVRFAKLASVYRERTSGIAKCKSVPMHMSPQHPSAIVHASMKASLFRNPAL